MPVTPLSLESPPGDALSKTPSPIGTSDDATSVHYARGPALVPMPVLIPLHLSRTGVVKLEDNPVVACRGGLLGGMKRQAYLEVPGDSTPKIRRTRSGDLRPRTTPIRPPVLRREGIVVRSDFPLRLDDVSSGAAGAINQLCQGSVADPDEMASFTLEDIADALNKISGEHIGHHFIHRVAFASQDDYQAQVKVLKKNFDRVCQAIMEIGQAFDERGMKTSHHFVTLLKVADGQPELDGGVWLTDAATSTRIHFADIGHAFAAAEALNAASDNSDRPFLSMLLPANPIAPVSRKPVGATIENRGLVLGNNMGSLGIDVQCLNRQFQQDCADVPRSSSPMPVQKLAHGDAAAWAARCQGNAWASDESATQPVSRPRVRVRPHVTSLRRSLSDTSIASTGSLSQSAPSSPVTRLNTQWMRRMLGDFFMGHGRCSDFENVPGGTEPMAHFRKTLWDKYDVLSRLDHLRSKDEVTHFVSHFDGDRFLLSLKHGKFPMPESVYLERQVDHKWTAASLNIAWAPGTSSGSLQAILQEVLLAADNNGVHLLRLPPSDKEVLTRVLERASKQVQCEDRYATFYRQLAAQLSSAGIDLADLRLDQSRPVGMDDKMLEALLCNMAVRGAINGPELVELQRHVDAARTFRTDIDKQLKLKSESLHTAKMMGDVVNATRIESHMQELLEARDHGMRKPLGELFEVVMQGESLKVSLMELASLMPSRLSEKILVDSVAAVNRTSAGIKGTPLYSARQFMTHVLHDTNFSNMSSMGTACYSSVRFKTLDFVPRYHFSCWLVDGFNAHVTTLQRPYARDTQHGHNTDIHRYKFSTERLARDQGLLFMRVIEEHMPAAASHPLEGPYGWLRLGQFSNNDLLGKHTVTVMRYDIGVLTWLENNLYEQYGRFAIQGKPLIAYHRHRTVATPKIFLPRSTLKLKEHGQAKATLAARSLGMVLRGKPDDQHDPGAFRLQLASYVHLQARLDAPALGLSQAMLEPLPPRDLAIAVAAFGEKPTRLPVNDKALLIQIIGAAQANAAPRSSRGRKPLEVFLRLPPILRNQLASLHSESYGHLPAVMKLLHGVVVPKSGVFQSYQPRLQLHCTLLQCAMQDGYTKEFRKMLARLIEAREETWVWGQKVSLEAFVGNDTNDFSASLKKRVEDGISRDHAIDLRAMPHVSPEQVDDFLRTIRQWMAGLQSPQNELRLNSSTNLLERYLQLLADDTARDNERPVLVNWMQVLEKPVFETPGIDLYDDLPWKEVNRTRDGELFTQQVARQLNPDGAPLTAQQKTVFCNFHREVMENDERTEDNAASSTSAATRRS